jgi:bifunctional DNA-binding transcriptional regulator/antitoxin component of YhaV-PrlF toxin-antitoxin module
METLIPTTTEIIRVRAKNQMTLPEAIATTMDIEPGDRFRAWVQEDGTLVLRKCSRSAYGKYKGVWGATTEEVVAHIREMRDEWAIREEAWERREQP